MCGTTFLSTSSDVADMADYKEPSPLSLFFFGTVITTSSSVSPPSFASADCSSSVLSVLSVRSPRISSRPAPASAAPAGGGGGGGGQGGRVVLLILCHCFNFLFVFTFVFFVRLLHFWWELVMVKM